MTKDELSHLTAEVERLRAALEAVLPLAESYLYIMPDRRGIHIPKLDAAWDALSNTTALKEESDGKRNFTAADFAKPADAPPPKPITGGRRSA